MNTVIWREKLKVAFNAHNLAVLGMSSLLLAAFGFGLVLPSFKEADRLAAEIPVERVRLEQTREIHLVAQALDDQLAVLREAAAMAPREFGPQDRESPVAVRRLAAEYRVAVRELSLEIPDNLASSETLKLCLQLVGGLESLRRLALDLVWLPSLVELAEIKVERDLDGFLLTALLLVDDQ
ncbi:hypothetical protein [Desulfurivibrio alkaliphilus]|uniref:Uncharacterized protein n=1 Tax=Desulfurivibrio alkaliphilus (strain DSM 19089 / UNIQEM U267 / AHT2) TaxID=589865 RepID=D6Z762_DESAT|nr:hypothetical protein [Desulfurivibrio alkaliphilus]ADH87049.1 hypothetical protein DaAHT2_2384 [Desulfurivibrio alkaliphilus AHT 2]